MLAQLTTAARLLAVLTVLTGALYPALVTGVAQFVLPGPAQGSLIERGERVVGSRLIGQGFSRPEYFWGRLSATAPWPYNAAASGGSNYGPLNPALREAAAGRLAALRAAGAPPEQPVPVDLVTASGSGLDPHISPAAADYQVARVAAVRGQSAEVLRELVRRHTAGRQWGLLGEPRVNVLELNLALDQLPPASN